MPAELRFGVGGRVDSEGREIAPFDEDSAAAVVQALNDATVESVAVCFLFSCLNPGHENRFRQLAE